MDDLEHDINQTFLDIGFATLVSIVFIALDSIPFEAKSSNVFRTYLKSLGTLFAILIKDFFFFNANSSLLVEKINNQANLCRSLHSYGEKINNQPDPNYF